jgi:hypothetical protein
MRVPGLLTFLFSNSGKNNNPSVETFTDYLVFEHENEVTIKGVLIFSGFEKFGIYFLYLFVPLIIYYIPLRGPFLVLIKLILMIIAFVITRKIINRYFAIKILEINKKQMELKSALDDFTVKNTDIKEVSIVEDAQQKEGKELMKYRLRFVLADGEKSSVFAFTSYNKAQELAKLIKTS